MPRNVELSTIAKRNAAERYLTDTAINHGARVEAEYRGREIRLVISLGDFRCAVSLSGDSRSDWHLASWFTVGQSSATFPDSFGSIGTVNQFHHAKATTIAPDIGALGFLLAQGLDQLSA